MSNTPLTDSEAIRSNCGTIVSADFARNLEIRMHKAERIVQLVDAINDLECNDEIFWNRGNIVGHEEGCFLNCNDAFAWGYSDAEILSVEDIPALREAHKDADMCDGSLLFIARKRKMRPQGAMYAHIEKKFWPLFDACGPARESCFGNPVGTDQIEAYVLKKQEEKAKKSAP